MSRYRLACIVMTENLERHGVCLKEGKAYRVTDRDDTSYELEDSDVWVDESDCFICYTWSDIKAILADHALKHHSIYFDQLKEKEL